MNRTWWKEAVIYQIYPISFKDSNGDGIGDLKGIIEKIDYLKYLGVDVVWLNPVYQSPMADNGYDISDYHKINKQFGTMEEWEELLAQLHKANIKLIMDLVVNHCSDEHAWFEDVKKNMNSQYKDYFIFRKGKGSLEPNNWESYFGGSVWGYLEEQDEYYLHLFHKKQPDLNWENAALRPEIYDMMRWWLDKGIDGFRMDVINLISKPEGLPCVEPEDGTYKWASHLFTNGPKVHDYIKEMYEKVLKDYDIMTVGETPDVTPEQGLLYTGENRGELNMIFHFEHMGVDRNPSDYWDIGEWRLKDLKALMRKWQTVLHGKAWNSLYMNNHDQPRMVSRFGNDKRYWKESAKLLATMVHTLEGTPYIYQGEEIGMTNVQFTSIKDYRDVSTINQYQTLLKRGLTETQAMNIIHRGSRDNARTPMQWSEKQYGGFSSSTPWISMNPNYVDINVEAQKNDADSILNYYRTLISLRKKYDVFIYGEYREVLEDNEQIYAYYRVLENKKLFVALNFSTQEASIKYSDWIDNSWSLLLSNYFKVTETKNDCLRAYETRVYYCEL